jgi:heptosyltransferase-2
LKRSAGKFTMSPRIATPSQILMLDFLSYLFYRALAAVVAALPLRLLFIIGNITGFFTWLILGKYRRLARHNLRIAFDTEKSPRELGRLVRRNFQRLSTNLLSSIKLSAAPFETWEKRIVVENFEILDRHLRAGRPVVLVLSHLGNWELVAQIVPRLLDGFRISTVYQKLENRFIDQYVHRLRAHTGAELFDRKEGFQKPIELLRAGGLIGILSDQHAGDHGLWTPFFGRLASTSPLPALLAKRTNAVLVAAALYTDGVARWRLVVEPALDPKNQSVESLTSKTNEVIAQQVRRAPEDWFWLHNRWKTPQPNLLLARYKRGVYLPATIPAKDLQPFRILIRASNWLGDSVISVPVVRAIKAGRPDAHITIAAPKKIAAIWKLVPEVDDVISLKSGSLFGAVRAIERQVSFDIAVLFPNSLRVALEVWLSDIPRRVGYRGHSRKCLLNQIVPENEQVGPPEHQALHYLRIAKNLGAEISDEFIVSKKTFNTQRSTPNAPYRLALCPGAEYGPAKRWLPERFAEAAKLISEKQPVQWILFGTKKDAASGKKICEALGDHYTNRIGQTTIEQLIDELRECRLLLTNDTGTMHLASLLGVPVVAIFGSTEPRMTGPLGQDHVVLRHQVECSPCFLRQCPIDFRCMKAVTVQETVDAVLSMLARPTPSSGPPV